MDVGLIYAETDKQNFNNSVHVKNFMHYLFRTDVNQKWTTNLTDGDILFVMIDGEIQAKRFGEVGVTSAEKLEYRSFLADLARQSIVRKHLAKTNQITYFELSKRISDEDLLALAGLLVEDKGLSGRANFSVLHVDQPREGLHLHTVYFS